MSKRAYKGINNATLHNGLLCDKIYRLNDGTIISSNDFTEIYPTKMLYKKKE